MSNDCIIVSGIAGADLTGARYNLVLADGTDESIQIQTSSSAQTSVGLLQNAPADNEIAKIAVSGLATGIAGAALEPFDYVMGGAGGELYLYVAATSNVCIGKYIARVIGGTAFTYRNAADGDHIQVLLGGISAVTVTA